MKLLQLTKKFPFPFRDGESIAVNNLANALNDLDWELDLLTMNTSKHPVEVHEITNELDHYNSIIDQDVDNKVTWLGAFKHLIQGKSYQANRFIDPRFRDKLIGLLKRKDYDVIQLESLYLSPYIDSIRQHSDAHIAMRAHNVEHIIWERLAKHTNWGLRKWYFKRIAKELEQLERSYFLNYDSIIAISDYDKRCFQQMGYRGQIISVPIGLDIEKFSLTNGNDNSPSLGFIGTLDWMPNAQGLEWFLKDVWPKVLKHNKVTPLHIAGRGANKRFKRLAKKSSNCYFHGEVECSNEFLQDHSILIVPLLSGSGMKVKILEGMAKGMLVITTSCGIEGIPAKHLKNVLVADSTDRLAAMVLYAINNPEDAAKIRKEARSFVEDKYDMHLQAKRLDSFYRQKINSTQEMPEPIITFEP